MLYGSPELTLFALIRCNLDEWGTIPVSKEGGTVGNLYETCTTGRLWYWTHRLWPVSNFLRTVFVPKSASASFFPLEVPGKLAKQPGSPRWTEMSWLRGKACSMWLLFVYFLYIKFGRKVLPLAVYGIVLPWRRSRCSMSQHPAVLPSPPLCPRPAAARLPPRIVFWVQGGVWDVARDSLNGWQSTERGLVVTDEGGWWVGGPEAGRSTEALRRAASVFGSVNGPVEDRMEPVCYLRRDVTIEHEYLMSQWKIGPVSIKVAIWTYTHVK